MPCTCPNLGSKAIYLVEPGPGPYTFDVNSERYALERNQLISDQEMIVDELTTGDRSTQAQQERDGNTNVGGPWRLKPNRVDLDNWLPRILGGAEVADVFTVADVLPEYAAWIDTGAKKFQYDDLKVNQATFTAESGQSLSLELEQIGKTFSTPVSATPSIDFQSGAQYRPLTMGVATLLIGGVDYCFNLFELVVNNNLEATFYNSTTAQCVEEGERVVTVRLGLPWNTDVASAVHGAGKVGTAITVTFPATNMQTQFRLPHVRWPDRAPTVEGPRGIPWTLEGRAFAVGATREIEVTNDSNPAV